jgi:hypothetical protein
MPLKLRRQSALAIIEASIVFGTENVQILPNGKGAFVFVVDELVPLLRDHGKLHLLDAFASQIFDYPNDPNSGEMRHATAITSGYVPSSHLRRSVQALCRVFDLQLASDRLGAPEGQAIVSCTTDY